MRSVTDDVVGVSLGLGGGGERVERSSPAFVVPSSAFKTPSPEPSDRSSAWTSSLCYLQRATPEQAVADRKPELISSSWKFDAPQFQLVSSDPTSMLRPSLRRSSGQAVSVCESWEGTRPQRPLLKVNGSSDAGGGSEGDYRGRECSEHTPRPRIDIARNPRVQEEEEEEGGEGALTPYTRERGGWGRRGLHDTLGRRRGSSSGSWFQFGSGYELRDEVPERVEPNPDDGVYLNLPPPPPPPPLLPGDASFSYGSLEVEKQPKTSNPSVSIVQSNPSVFVVQSNPSVFVVQSNPSEHLDRICKQHQVWTKKEEKNTEIKLSPVPFITSEKHTLSICHRCESLGVARRPRRSVFVRSERECIFCDATNCCCWQIEALDMLQCDQHHTVC
ncbi:hypothetical protein EYF80_041255 [Liparis tanakae]|uniref:Uncharacterized protein n=1 Tax=Liparis tanakae TaxID=230148 RepID=A0A4Z2G4W4_9TELE|nr:hypothetical protein EYF80_041255 [Liparis tanakae]